MRSKQAIKVKFSQIILFVILTLLFFSLLSCRINYTGQYFYFPPESNKYNDNWEYKGYIFVEGYGSHILKSNKRIRITVKDRKDQLLLDEKLTLTCASLRSQISWTDFEKLEIILFEKGNKYSDDSYNRELVKKGPNTLTVLTYAFNSQLGKFERL